MIIRNIVTEPQVVSMRSLDGTKQRIYLKPGEQIEVPDFTPTGDLAVKKANKIISIRKSR